MKLQLRASRKQRRITQHDLAKQLAVDVTTIGNWERGNTVMNIEQLFRCCEILDSTPNELTGWYIDHPEDKPGYTGPPGLTPDESRVVESYRELTPERRRVMAEQMEDAAVRSRGQEGAGESYEESTA